MPWEDFNPERRVCIVQARRFVCRRPTVATMLEFFGNFYVEIAEYLRAWDKFTSKQREEDPLLLLVPRFAEQGERFARVLATCVELPGAAAGELQELVKADSVLAVGLATTVLSMCNVQRIYDSMDFTAIREAPDMMPDEPAVTDVGEEQVTAQVLNTVLLAQMFGQSPMAIMDWPYEALLTVNEALPYLSGQKKLPQSAASPFTLGTMPGIGIG